VCGDRCKCAEKLVPVAASRLELAVDRVEREADVCTQSLGVRGVLVDVGSISSFLAGHRFGDLSWLYEQFRERSGPFEHRAPVRTITGWYYSLTRHHRRKASRDVLFSGCQGDCLVGLRPREFDRVGQRGQCRVRPEQCQR
jgi:hypothetical protein